MSARGGEGNDQLWGVDVVQLLGGGVLWLGGGVDDQAEWTCIAEYHCRVPISVSYLHSFFKATNLTQTTKKTTMDFVLSFLQMLHCSLH